MRELRVCERYDRTTDTWKELRMCELKVDDIFRLTEDDGYLIGIFRADDTPFDNEEGIATIVAMPFDLETWSDRPFK